MSNEIKDGCLDWKHTYLKPIKTYEHSHNK